MSEEKIITKYRVNNWDAPEGSKLFVGNYETGVVNIPEGEFSAEQIKGWVEEGVLTVIE